MRKFTCPNCGARLYFENFLCENCRSAVAFDPLAEHFERLEDAHACGNRSLNVCNWRTHGGDTFCQSCRLDHTIPRLDDSANIELWRRLEFAKRRVLYDFARLGLTTPARGDGPDLGLAFDFLSSAEGPVVTGHDEGLITINLAEADDARREQIRSELHEPYRTLVGHFRHECGHYLWQRFVAPGAELARFREVFGDERADYAQALRDHYANPSAPSDQFVSDYAATHPWEDWAECAAHYLHIVSTLDTFVNSPLGAPEGARPVGDPYRERDFDAILSQWFPLAETLNELNRSMGLHDPYPFVLSAVTIDKLRLVQQVVQRAAEKISHRGNQLRPVPVEQM